MEIGDKRYLLDDCDGHYGQQGTIINKKNGPFGKGCLVDIKFEDGYILPDVLPSEISKELPVACQVFNSGEAIAWHNITLTAEQCCNIKMPIEYRG